MSRRVTLATHPRYRTQIHPRPYLAILRIVLLTGIVLIGYTFPDCVLISSTTQHRNGAV